MKHSYDSIDDFFDLLYMVDKPVSKEDFGNYGWKSTDYGMMKSFDTHGIIPENINVDIKNNTVNVYGESTYNNIDYKVNYKEKLPYVDSVENISFESKNGVTYIYVKFKEVTDNSIKINRM